MIGDVVQMFALLFHLRDQGVIDAATKYVHDQLIPDPSAPYRATMHSNAVDGKPFTKPALRGYEDACNLTGQC